MQIDLRTVQIKPLRQTYDHIARRFGDKPASRYQEASYDVQAVTNFHYRPYWDPEHEVFDASRTKIKMKDWYSFRDPRQFYYAIWWNAGRMRTKRMYSRSWCRYVMSRGAAI